MLNKSIFGLILVLLGAFITFVGSAAVERITKKELSVRQVTAVKMIGFIVVLGGVILVFRFGGRI